MALGRRRGDKARSPAEEPTAAERAGAEVAERAGLLERVLDASDEGVVYTDSAAGILLINRAARGILGLGPRRSSPGLDAIGMRELVSEALERGEAFVRERDLHVPNRRTLSIRTMPFEDGALLLISDVTQTRRAEGVRRDFVANVSHELKTPVSGIALMAEQLSHAIREDREAALRFASRIHDEAERLASMAVDLLDLSKIESGRPLEISEVDALAVVTEAVARVETVADAKGVRIHISAPDEQVVFPGDAGQVATALGNLLDNAVRYSPEGSAVSIAIAARDDEVSFAVEDPGPGIPTTELSRIFERFYRVDKARARATGGTGLGLSIVKHVADRHGGRVAADSEPGRGSRFLLSFPMEAQKP